MYILFNSRLQPQGNVNSEGQFTNYVYEANLTLQTLIEAEDDYLAPRVSGIYSEIGEDGLVVAQEFSPGAASEPQGAEGGVSEYEPLNPFTLGKAESYDAFPNFKAKSCQ